MLGFTVPFQFLTSTEQTKCMAVKIILQDHSSASVKDLLFCLRLVKKAAKVQSSNIVSLEVTWTDSGKFGGLLRTKSICLRSKHLSRKKKQTLLKST